MKSELMIECNPKINKSKMKKKNYSKKNNNIKTYLKKTIKKRIFEKLICTSKLKKALVTLCSMMKRNFIKAQNNKITINFITKTLIKIE